MNSKDLNNFIAGIWIIAAVWDSETTFKGVYDIWNSGLVAFLFTLFINGILLFSFMKIEHETLRGLRILGLVLAIVGDLYTAIKGNISLAKSQFEIEDVFGAYMVTAFLTLFSLIGTFFTAYNINQTVIKNDAIAEAELEKKKQEELLKKKD